MAHQPFAEHAAAAGESTSARPAAAPCPLLRNLLKRLPSEDRGSMGVETVIVWTAVLLIAFATIQAGLYFHGVNIASHAAAAGANAASREGGTAGDGQSAASNILSQSGTLDGAGVNVIPTAQDVTVTVTGAVPTLVPGWTLTVSQSTSSTLEQYREP